MTSAARRPYRDFGAWLRSRRLARRWTQEELGRLLGYDVTYVRKIEWGERRPSEALRVRLAQVLGVPVSGLPQATANAVAARHRLESAGALVGRDREVEAVVGLFDRGARLVTVVGAPGIGKTRLAQGVAARLDERLPGGARFVPLLSVTDGATIVPPIAEALGITVPAEHEAADRLADALASQELVLILDNFEHVLPSAPLVGELLGRVPQLRVLVTSREPLELRSEVLYAIPALAVPAAGAPPEEVATVASVALFEASARKVLPDFAVSVANATAVADICRRLQGIPLAIELAAGATRLLTPHALLAQLGHGLELPAGPRDAPDHHRTLRAAIDWSFARLAPEEGSLLSRLAVFPGGCTIDAATAVCDRPGAGGLASRRGVLTLARKSLLEPLADPSGDTRFVALEAVRAFALEQLASSGEREALGRRHAAWAVDVAETNERRLTGAAQAEALAALEAEHVNLRAALDWSLAHDPPVALRLCASLWRFWWIRGHVDDGRQWLARALTSRPEGPAHDAAVSVRALAGAGVLARAQGEYEAARALLEEGRDLSRAAGDELGLALSLLNLGIVAADQARYDEASAHFQEAMERSAGVGDLRGVGHSLNCLGSVRLGQGEPEASAALFERALLHFRELGDDWSAAMVLANLGWAAHKQGRPAVARLLYGKGLEMYRALGDDRGAATMLLNLGILGDDPGAEGDATGLLEEAVLMFSRLGERRRLAECLESLAAARLPEDPATAVALVGASDSLREGIGAARWPEELAGYERALGLARRRLGDASFEVALASGRVMPRHEVIATALARPTAGT